MAIERASGPAALRPLAHDARPSVALVVRLGLLLGVAAAIYLLGVAFDRPAHAAEVQSAADRRSAVDSDVAVRSGSLLPLDGLAHPVTDGLRGKLTGGQGTTPTGPPAPERPSSPPGPSKPSTQPSRPDRPQGRPGEPGGSRPQSPAQDPPSSGTDRPGETPPPATGTSRPGVPAQSPTTDVGPFPFLPGLPALSVEEFLTGTMTPLRESIDEVAALLPLGLGDTVQTVTGIVVDTVSTVGTVVDDIVALPGTLLPGLDPPGTDRPAPAPPPTGHQPTDTVPQPPVPPATGPPVAASDPTNRPARTADLRPTRPSETRHRGGVRSGTADGGLPALPVAPAAGVNGARTTSSSNCDQTPGTTGRERWVPETGAGVTTFPETLSRAGRAPLAWHVPG